jgi:hypothetical protein
MRGESSVRRRWIQGAVAAGALALVTAGPAPARAQAELASPLAVAGPLEAVNHADATIAVGGVRVHVPAEVADLSGLEAGSKVAVWYQMQAGRAVATALDRLEADR